VLPTGETREAPYYLFKLIHLRQPLAAGPIRLGDPVWLQVCDGRGDDGWQSGGVLAPYVQHAVTLDPSGVDVEGHPVGWTRLQRMTEGDVESESRAGVAQCRCNPRPAAPRVI
jgi:hypothetical protein